MNYSLTKAQAKDLISGKLSHFFGVSTQEASDEQYYRAVALIVKDLMHEGVRERRKAADDKPDGDQAHRGNFHDSHDRRDRQPPIRAHAHSFLRFRV